MNDNTGNTAQNTLESFVFLCPKCVLYIWQDPLLKALSTTELSSKGPSSQCRREHRQYNPFDGNTPESVMGHLLIKVPSLFSQAPSSQHLLIVNTNSPLWALPSLGPELLLHVLFICVSRRTWQNSAMHTDVFYAHVQSAWNAQVRASQNFTVMTYNTFTKNVAQPDAPEPRETLFPGNQ